MGRSSGNRIMEFIHSVERKGKSAEKKENIDDNNNRQAITDDAFVRWMEQSEGEPPQNLKPQNHKITAVS